MNRTFMNRGLYRFTERVLLVTGVSLLFLVGATVVHRSVSSRLALLEFDALQSAAPSDTPALPADKVDFSLWSAKRIREYQASLLVKKDPPLAVLRIEKLKLRAPVFEGTDELVLNRGVGWIVGTARPGDGGAKSNIGLAAHRDSFFRGFKNITIGDSVELVTPGVVSRYAVDHIEIVYPENVGVLRPRSEPSLTLVTCYPFYFVGDAPQRYIVHAALKQRSPS